MSKYKVDFINSSYRRWFAAHREEVTNAIVGCYERGDFILRDEVNKFEKTLADYIGVKYAVSVNSGSDAIRLGLQALGFTDGDACIVPSNTFIASLEEPIHLGGGLELVDVTEDGLCNVDQIERALELARYLVGQGQKVPTIYIQPVHLYGKVCDMKRIMQLAAKHGIPVLEDACQALGASRDGKKAGAWGDAAAFSFIAPKLLGAGGDGGAVVTNRADVYEKLLLLRNHWNINQNALIGHQPKRPERMGWGWNSRMDNTMAAVLNVKFRYIDQIIANRKRVAETYLAQLQGLPLKLPTTQEGQVWQEFVLEVEERDELADFLLRRGVETLVRDTTPNHKLPGLCLEHFDLPVTERLARTAIRLPVHPDLYESEIQYVVNKIKEFYATR